MRKLECAAVVRTQQKHVFLDGMRNLKMNINT